MLKVNENEIYIGEVSKIKKESDCNFRGMIVNLEAGTIVLGWFKDQ